MLTIKPNSFSHNVDTEMQLTALTLNWNLLKCVPAVPFSHQVCFVSFLFRLWAFLLAFTENWAGGMHGNLAQRSVGQFSNSARSSIAIGDQRSHLPSWIYIFLCVCVFFFLFSTGSLLWLFCVNVLIDRSYKQVGFWFMSACVQQRQRKNAF